MIKVVPAVPDGVRVLPARHALGPWCIELGEIVSDDDQFLGVIYRTEAWASGDPVYTEDQANASLIGAAPDLLALAQRWAGLDAGSWHPDRHASEKRDLLLDTHAAIAKAAGRAP